MTVSNFLLTDRQAEVLRYIAEHIVQHQRPPTCTGMALHFGWSSPNAAKDHMNALAAKGYIVMDGPDSNGGEGARYPRVVRWPDGVLPVLRLAAAA